MVSKLFTTFVAIIKNQLLIQMLQYYHFPNIVFRQKNVHFRHHKSKTNVNRKRYSWQLTVSINEFFAVQITDNSFGKEKNREDSVIVPTHYLLLENLLSSCKALNINTPRKRRQPQETNWKQKFQKPKNENIWLTYLNTETNGIFHFLSSCDCSNCFPLA